MMKIIAVDDEKIGLEGMVSSIKEVEDSAEVYSFQKAEEALEFCRTNICDVAFLDIQMGRMSGIELAKQIKILNPSVNIIFATGYGEYREAAFDMHASGYLTKPITPKKVKSELDNLRYDVKSVINKRVQFCTFGNFEVYIDGNPVQFKYDRTKEMLAYLVDRNGAYCTNTEIMAILWGDEKRSSYLSNLRKDLFDTLRGKNSIDIIDTGWGKMRIIPEKVDCDYYDWCNGDVQAINLYRGEYMTQYGWAEFTNAMINKETN